MELIYNDRPSRSRCTGLRMRDGIFHSAQTIICALGAYGASIVPELGSFNVARSWSFAHVQLSGTRCNMLRGLPVVHVRDLGFFFEPDPATQLFKLCPLGAGYTNTDPTSGVSLPPADEGLLPQAPEDEQKLHSLRRQTLTLGGGPAIRGSEALLVQRHAGVGVLH